MTRQLIKTANELRVTYHSERKWNKFVITDHGKVVIAYGNWHSCLYWLLQNTQDFDREYPN